MAANRTCLSAGAAIRAILSADKDVCAKTNKIFPVVEDSAELPYIVYRRTSLSGQQTKGKQADTVSIEILCYTAHYTDGVELAESVRGALGGASGDYAGMTIRSCYLEDSEEAWQDDAHVQQLVFTVRI